MITIDKRELRSPVPGYLQKLYPDAKFDILPIGDYIADNTDQKPKERVDIGCERKSLQDYISSMISGHLNNQLYELSTNYAMSALIVEGGSVTEALMYRKMKRQQYWSSVAGSFLKRSPDGLSGVVGIIFTETAFDTALFIKSIHDKLSEKDGLVRLPRLVKVKISDAERLKGILMGIPKIGEKRAEILLSHYGSLKKVFSADYYNITAIKGIPRPVAVNMWELMNKEVKVKRAAKN